MSAHTAYFSLRVLLSATRMMLMLPPLVAFVWRRYSGHVEKPLSEEKRDTGGNWWPIAQRNRHGWRYCIHSYSPCTLKLRPSAMMPRPTPVCAEARPLRDDYQTKALKTKSQGNHHLPRKHVRGVSWSEVATVPKRKSHRGLDLDLSLNSEVNIRKGWKENGGTK